MGNKYFFCVYYCFMLVLGQRFHIPFPYSNGPARQWHIKQVGVQYESPQLWFWGLKQSTPRSRPNPFSFSFHFPSSLCSPKLWISNNVLEYELGFFLRARTTFSNYTYTKFKMSKMLSSRLLFFSLFRYCAKLLVLYYK